MLNAAERWLAPAEIDNAEVLVFRMRQGMIAKHCAIVSGPQNMIHADAASKMVVETAITKYWLDRIAGRYRFQW
jgi:cell wall-associated NlpC family hydrolase